MNNYTTVVGLDVHKETIVAAVLPQGYNEPQKSVKVTIFDMVSTEPVKCLLANPEIFG